jgi:UDP-N-acetylglucosamine 2-epimerase (non-hydrolysing)
MPVRILVVAGTRPEAIKLAPVILALRERAQEFEVCVCATAQHREMLDGALALFGIEPDFDLDLMRPDQSLAQLTAGLFAGLDGVLDSVRPDWVVVQGDTTSTLVASLAAFYRRIAVAHVEAGLRTGDRLAPFPEEINRRVVDLVADLYLAPTPRAAERLCAEGVDPTRIRVTGNTGIDALQRVLAQPYDAESGPLAGLPRGARLLLVTAHRRESLGAPLARICRAVREVAQAHAPRAHVVWPVHPNPRVAGAVREALADAPGVHVLPPLGYRDFAQLVARCALVLSDSGGLQEEGPSLGRPVLILRDATERSEAIEAGCARLVGTDPPTIAKQVERLLCDPRAYAQMARPTDVFGDGRAAQRICEALIESSRGVRP